MKTNVYTFGSVKGFLGEIQWLSLAKGDFIILTLEFTKHFIGYIKQAPAHAVMKQCGTQQEEVINILCT